MSVNRCESRAPDGGRASLARGATDPWRIVSRENYRGYYIELAGRREIGVWCKWSSPAEYASVTREDAY